ncbi:MAG: EF-P beta-lysylation protein EpmB [Psittacicella sp.]
MDKYTITNIDTISWQSELKNSFLNPKDFLEYLNLNPKEFIKDIEAKNLFSFRVTKHFASLMKKQDPKDPLFMQVITSKNEFIEQAGFNSDPLEEKGSNPLPGLLHKYTNRVLLIFKTSCATNCRYCFRRDFPYSSNGLSKEKLLDILDYIKSKSELDEVILSGGDPLSSTDEHLKWFINKLETINHIKLLRIHTRFPIMIPSRITDKLCKTFKNSRLTISLVFHINHQNEIDQRFTNCAKKLKDANVILLNQNVLLKNINDNPITLKNLNMKLVSIGIIPYYLFLFDKVKGATHFYVDNKKAKEIYLELQKISSGFTLPKLSRELPNQEYKTLIPINTYQD